MFLKKIKNLTGTIGFKLTLGFCLLFVVSSICVFLLTYSLFFKSLEQKDHQMIESKLNSYSLLFSKDGIKGLKQVVATEISREENSNYLIRLQDLNGKTLFLHLPAQSEEFGILKVENSLSRATPKKEWMILNADSDEDEMEVLSVPIDKNYLIQVVTFPQKTGEFENSDKLG